MTAFFYRNFDIEMKNGACWICIARWYWAQLLRRRSYRLEDCILAGLSSSKSRISTNLLGNLLPFWPFFMFFVWIAAEIHSKTAFPSKQKNPSSQLFPVNSFHSTPSVVDPFHSVQLPLLIIIPLVKIYTKICHQFVSDLINSSKWLMPRINAA